MATIVSGVLLFVCATPVRATTFAIEPITFFSDATASITATGTITTADNSSVITDWNLKVTTSSRFAQR